MVYIPFGIGASNPDLSHVRNVEHATMLAYCVVLIDDGCVLNRHVETAKRLNERTQRHVFVIQTGSLVFHIP